MNVGYVHKSLKKFSKLFKEYLDLTNLELLKFLLNY